MDFLAKFIPMMLTAIIACFIFSIIDRKYKFIEKFISKSKIKKEWQPFFIVTSSLLIIFFIGIIGIYIIDIPNTVFHILSGIPLGLVMYISDKLNPNKKNKDKIK